MKLAPAALRRSLRAMRSGSEAHAAREPRDGAAAPSGRSSGPVYVVETSDLTKIYDNRYIALNALNMRVRKNSVYGLVGPNGAGKSTAFRIMLGLQRPTAGEIRVFGQPMSAASADLRRRIGFLPTAPSFPRQMTPIAYLGFVGSIVGLPHGSTKIRLATLLQAVDLTDVASQRIEGFSTGMVTRLGIAAALMNDPELLVLDEPTYGLDPAGRKQMIELIRELAGRDRTIIIATHILNDVERVCTDIGVIAQGRLIYDGPMTEMRRLARQDSISIEIEGNADSFEEQIRGLAEPRLGALGADGLGVPDHVPRHGGGHRVPQARARPRRAHGRRVVAARHRQSRGGGGVPAPSRGRPPARLPQRLGLGGAAGGGAASGRRCGRSQRWEPGRSLLMRAYLHLLRLDVEQMARSWLVRAWIVLLVAPAGFAVVVAATEQELASETLAAYMAFVLAPLSWLVVAVLSASAVSGEVNVIADSILSRSVTRRAYIWSKISARLGVFLGVYVAVTVPLAYLVLRYAENDAQIEGVAWGLLMVASLLVFLAAFGIALSAIFRSMLSSVLTVLVATLASGAALQFLTVDWMSTTAVVSNLPETFRGEMPVSEHVRVLIVFGVLSVVAIASGISYFHRRDL